MQVIFHSGPEYLFDGYLIYQDPAVDKLLKISHYLFDGYLIVKGFKLLK
jgi:hypothetical protein